MNQSTPAITDSPKLQAALDNLELDLELELRRYRRQVQGQTSSTAAPVQPMTDMWQSSNEPSAVEVEVNDTADNSTDPAFASVSLPTPENPQSRSPEVSKVLEMLENPNADGKGEGLLNLENAQAQPQDYLESSEELLKTLERDEDPKKSTTKKKSRFTPVQIGFISAGVVGVALLAIAVIFPNAFQPAATVVETDPNSSETVAADAVAPVPTTRTVNLASNEFVELSLDNLSVVDPDGEAIAPVPSAQASDLDPATPVPQPSALPSENPDVPTPLVPPTGREDLASALLPPSLRPQPVNSFPVTPQAVAPSTANNTPMETPDGLKVGFHYVIFKNTTPRGLEKAKAQVSDAFVRNFPVGEAIQMAEIASAEQAQNLAKQFNDAKITAEVYHHQLTPAQ